MNPAVVLRALDLAVLGFAALERYTSAAAADVAVTESLSRLRVRLLRGEVSDDQALAELDLLIGGVIGRRRGALARLPKPGQRPDI